MRLLNAMCEQELKDKFSVFADDTVLMVENEEG